MSFYFQFSWAHFSIAFGAVLILTFIMGLQSRNFYTNHVVVRKFSILDLQFPASALELVNYIKGIFSLPANLTRKVLKNLRGQIYLDFLFMIAAYGTVFILCMKVSMKMSSFGQGLFAVLAWMQILPFLFDVIGELSDPALHTFQDLDQNPLYIPGNRSNRSARYIPIGLVPFRRSPPYHRRGP